PSSPRTTTASAGNRPDLLPARAAFLTGLFQHHGLHPGLVPRPVPVAGHEATAIRVGASGSGSMPVPLHRRHGPPSGLVRSPTQATQTGSCFGILLVMVASYFG